MRRIFVCLFVFVIVISGYSQNKIPRRVVYEVKTVNKSDGIGAFIPSILNARINDIQTVIPVDRGNRHHNVIKIEITGTNYIFSLEDASGLLDRKKYKAEGDLANVEKICTSVAASWKQYLGPAEPFVEDVVVRERKKLSSEALFEESLSTAFQVTYWLTAVRSAIDTAGGGPSFGTFFPQSIDFNWYVFPTWGINLSFYGEASRFMSFGNVNTVSGDPLPGESFNTLLLPGVGITFRSLGRISGNYGFTLYLGPAYIKAIDTLVNNEGSQTLPILAAGDSRWVIFPFLSMRTGISWNISPSWSIKSRLVLFISPLVFASQSVQMNQGYLPGKGAAMETVIQLGAGYRW